jgi:enoyl-[acyl-carrier protein] reductase I
MNDRSIAWFIAKELLAQGARCLFTYLPDDSGKNERRVRGALQELGLTDVWLEPCDVGKDQDLDAVFGKIGVDFPKMHFIVHSLAFAHKQYLRLDTFHQTPRAVWTQALDISAYSLLAMAQRAIDLMPDGGSVVAMTYYGGERVIPGYNVMGIAKAALEHTARYLAFELGDINIRFNTISAGPMRTLSASAVGGINEMFSIQEHKAALRRNIDGHEIGRTAAYLLSDMSSGVTGENIHVDAGFNIVGL